MLIYCMKCETANEEDESFCAACKNPLKAMPMPEKVAPWKKQAVREFRTVPTYMFLGVVSSVISCVGLLCVLPLPAAGVVLLFSSREAPSVPPLVWAILVCAFVYGVFIVAFSELLNCMRDIARNSYR